jgi:hypothetical protein
MRKVPRPFSYSWGSGEIIEEASAPNPYYEPVIQLLRPIGGAHDGEDHIRFCFYSPKGAFQRHPLVMGPTDIAGLNKALEKTPLLHKLIKHLAE